MRIQRLKNLALIVLFMFGSAHASEVLLLAELSLDQAVKKVVKGNRLLDAETKSIDDRKVHVIKVLTEDGRVKKHKIDAETGQSLGKGK